MAAKPRAVGRKLLAGILALLLVAAVLLVLVVAVGLSTPREPLLELREVHSAPAKPPPPPAARQQEPERRSRIELQVSGSGPALEKLPELDMRVADFAAPEQFAPPPGQASIELPEVEWRGFSLDQLDMIPRLISMVSLNVPTELRRRLRDVITLRLEVSINRQGEVTLLRIVESPDPALEFSIRQMVARARFTPPQRHGEAVEARFIWPLEVDL